jgi:tetratricopeptide (TPR) repeat protein
VLPSEEDIDLVKRTGEIVVQPSEFGEGSGGLDSVQGMAGVTSLALVTCRQQHSLGLAFQSLRKYEAALEHFQLALALWAGHAPSRYHSSLMLHALGDHDQAEGELGVLLHREPDSQRVLEARGLARQAMGHHAAAIADFSEALRVEERGETYYHRAVSHLASKPQPGVEDALRDLKSARKTGFKRGEEYDKCATAFLLQGDVPSAIAAYSAALELDPTNLSYLARRSQCHRELGDAAEAEKDLTVALAMPHADASLLYLRGLARYDQDQFDDCVNDLEAALRSGVDPSTLPDVYYSIGLAHANSDRHLEAEAAFSAALGVQPPPPRSLQLLYVHERAKSRQMIQWHEDAVQDFGTVIALNGGNAHAYFRRAFSQKALGKYEAAAEDFETARMLQPTNPHLVVSYSTLHEVETIILCAAGEEPAFDDARFPSASVAPGGEEDEAYGPPGSSTAHQYEGAIDEDGVSTMRDKIVRQAALQAGGRGSTPGATMLGAAGGGDREHK